MTPNEPDLEDGMPEPRPRGGVRLRLWLGCLGGSIVAAVGLWWSIGPIVMGETIAPDALIFRLSGAAAAGVLVAVILAAWLDRGIVLRLRWLARVAAAVQVPGTGGKARPGWGEFADLTLALRALVQQHRVLARRAADHAQLVRDLNVARQAIETWRISERWSPLHAEDPPLRELFESLNLGFARHGEIVEQNQEASRQIRDDVRGSLDDARESSEQAERAFVESTGLRTTLRDLQRLSAELEQALAAPPVPGEGEDAAERWRASAAEAIESLVVVSGASVEELGAGLLRVREIAGHVQVIANRATLIALNSLVAATRETGGPPDTPGELRQLAREVREVADGVEVLTREVERDVQAAATRMRELRAEVGSRLEAPEPEPAPAVPPADSVRAIERLRELVQDAAGAGERLSVSGERASRSAERLMRKLDDSVRDLEGLVVRLSPPGVEPGPAGGPEDGGTA